MGEQRTAMLCEVENQDFRIFEKISYSSRKEIKQYSFDIDAYCIENSPSGSCRPFCWEDFEVLVIVKVGNCSVIGGW